jgi:hypothetical protein
LKNILDTDFGLKMSERVTSINETVQVYVKCAGQRVCGKMLEQYRAFLPDYDGSTVANHGSAKSNHGSAQ